MRKRMIMTMSMRVIVTAMILLQVRGQAWHEMLGKALRIFAMIVDDLAMFRSDPCQRRVAKRGQSVPDGAA